MYDPNKHNRHSIRLNDYNYSRHGRYFVTICVQNHKCLFGKIKDGKMFRNESGEMIESWIMELANKFQDVAILSSIVMPNHIHAIISNANTPITAPAPVGSPLRVCPVYDADNVNDAENDSKNVNGTQNKQDEHVGSPLHRIIQWFKTMTTNEYIRGVITSCFQPFYRKLWQRNYYEHIIRNEQSFHKIAEYIYNNPQNWQNDKMFSEVQ